ncbi:MAG: hypothetical protein GY820_36485 [Gammaproteobacteria bacterium]|nr:hypothetical protein [Gammaproteobacteria bacterium]
MKWQTFSCVVGVLVLWCGLSDTGKLPIIARGDYFFVRVLGGAIIGGGRLLEGGDYYFEASRAIP